MTDAIDSGYWMAVDDHARTVAAFNATKRMLQMVVNDNAQLKDLAAGLEERLELAEQDADRLAQAITVGHPCAQFNALDHHIEALEARK